MERKKKMEKRNGKALLPIFVFVVLYLGLGILFEYGLRIEMGFYKIPVVVIFLIALLVACLQNRALQLNDKLAVMGTGISDPNIITMILIFMLAGIFVGVVGRSSANSVAYFILSRFRRSLRLRCFSSSAVLYHSPWAPLSAQLR